MMKMYECAASYMSLISSVFYNKTLRLYKPTLNLYAAKIQSTIEQLSAHHNQKTEEEEN
jgi:hypothetical protein